MVIDISRVLMPPCLLMLNSRLLDPAEPLCGMPSRQPAIRWDFRNKTVTDRMVTSLPPRLTLTSAGD